MDTAANRDIGAESPLIAVIDDDALFVKMLHYFLPNVGFRAVTWTRASGAAAMVERERPALVLLDMRMENDRSGMEVLRVLRERPETAGIPVLFVTAWADTLSTNEREEIRAARGEMMMKPFEFEYLLGRMHVMMDTTT